MKCSLSLLLITCCLFTAVQLSVSEPDHPEAAQNTHAGAKRDSDHSPQSRTDGTVPTLTLSDDHVNSTDSSSGAKFVRASDTEAKLRTGVRNDESGEPDKGEKSQENGASPNNEEGEKGKESKSDGASKKKDDERIIVTHIPELPASIAKPGRLYNASWFIMFYAAWCEHSQLAEPEFLNALQMLADSNITGMYIGKIDVTKHAEVAKHFKIKGTPTFAFFKFGIRFDFIEATNTKNLFEFAANIMTATIDQVNTTQHLAALQKNHSVLFLLVHDEEIDADWHSVYMRLAAQEILDAKFAYTTHPDLVKAHGIDRLPCVMVLKEGKAFVYKEALSGYSLSRWILIEKFLTFPTVNESNIRHHLRPVSGRRLGVLVVDENPSERRIAQKKATEVVKRFALSRKEHKKYQFLLLEGADVAKKLLGRSVDLPAFFVYEPYVGLHYFYQSEGKGITEESLKAFLHDISSGQINPQGGASFLDTIIHVGRLGYAVFMTMVTHRPILSLAALLSLLGASLFYLVIYCQKKQQPKVVGKSSRALAKKAALKKKREETRKEAAASSKDDRGKESSVRKRNQRDDTGIDSEEMSQSDARTGTGSGTGTQTEGETDSQVELSGTEETKKTK